MRREAGKSLMKRKQDLEEKELKEMATKRRKEKEEDRLAKQRVQ